MDTQASQEWTEVHSNLTCLSSLSGISIHHSARENVRDKQGNTTHTATPQTVRGCVRFIEPLIVNADYKSLWQMFSGGENLSLASFF